ncbi:hypothetical protein QYF36_022528 [Acer negundo]|nr:hypothetical protein QYF36_022528 [Acer negundo]
MGNIPPAAAAPRGRENPRNFCKLVRILIEHKKYKKTMEQSVELSLCNPFETYFHHDPYRLKRQFGHDFAFEERIQESKDDEQDQGDNGTRFELEERKVAAGFFEAGLDAVDLLGFGLFMRIQEMHSQATAVQKEIPTTVRLSEYLSDDNIWAVAMLFSQQLFGVYETLQEDDKKNKKQGF